MIVVLSHILAAAKCTVGADGLSQICPGNIPHPAADTASIDSILGIVFNTIGAFALLVITVSGLRYITAAGDPQQVSKAKNGVLYALVGLIIAISARAIVAFVGNRVGQ